MVQRKRKPSIVEIVDNPVVISWSEIDALRQCPFKHHLSYRERWQGETTSEPLLRGTAWHELLEVHYSGLKEGTPLAAKRAAKTIATLLNSRGEQTERQELLQWMLEGYIEWSMDKDPGWTVREVEWKGFAPLPNPSGKPSRFMLKVKIDLVAVRGGRLWIWDHKSGKNLPSDKELDLDDQFGLYIWCMRQLGYPVAGAIHNCARTQRNKGPMLLTDRFSRIPLSRTDIELDTIAREAYMSAEKAWPLVPVDGPPERTPNTDMCRWRCDHTEACLMSRKGGRIEDMLVAHGFSKRPFREVELEWKAVQLSATTKSKG